MPVDGGPVSGRIKPVLVASIKAYTSSEEVENILDLIQSLSDLIVSPSISLTFAGGYGKSAMSPTLVLSLLIKFLARVLPFIMAKKLC